MDADGRSDVRGVVLAGGESRRFGDKPKALATFDGDPLVVRVARAVREATGGPPLVAVRGPADREPLASVLPDATFVEDDPEFEGPLAGVAGAARAATAPWLFVCACDMPLLSAPAVAWLADRADGADAVVVAVDGVDQPTHALYSREAVLTALPALPGDAGVRSLVGALPAVRRLPVEAGGSVDLAASLTNVNRRAELRALRERRAGESTD